jgi:hypothetical protein
MIDHEQRIAEVLHAVTVDVRTRPTLGVDVRRGALRRRRRRIATRTAGTAVLLAAASVVAVVGARGLGLSRPDLGQTPTAAPSVPASPSASASQPPPAPGRCAVDRLPVPGNEPRSLVTGGDRTGRYLLGRAYASVRYVDDHPILIWDHGQPTVVQMPGSDESLVDINSAGVAVGNSFRTDDFEVPYVYRDGALTPLAGVSGSVEARAIGEQGTIVGGRSNRAGQASHPVVWRDPGSRMADLPVPAAGWEGWASDVDADGTIVGTLTNGPSLDFRGFVWAPDGTVRQLPLPQIDGAPALSFAPISVAGGVVFARATKDIGNGGFEVVPVLLDLRTEKFTVLTRGMSFRTGSSEGWVAGTAREGLVVASASGQAVLPPLPDAAKSELSIDEVTTISQDGRVLGGQLTDGTGQFRAVRWTCTRA